MTFTLGLLLLAVTVAMLVMGRPSDGVAAPLLRSWLAGQAYTLTTLVTAVLGITVIVTQWPF